MVLAAATALWTARVSSDPSALVADGETGAEGLLAPELEEALGSLEGLEGETGTLALDVFDAADEASFSLEGDVPEAAAEVLEGYAERGDCVLAQAGYLGLLGDSWGCVVTGGDWADVCVVAAQTDTERSEVRIWRITAKEVAAAAE